MQLGLFKFTFSAAVNMVQRHEDRNKYLAEVPRGVNAGYRAIGPRTLRRMCVCGLVDVCVRACASVCVCACVCVCV